MMRDARDQNSSSRNQERWMKHRLTVVAALATVASACASTQQRAQLADAQQARARHVSGPQQDRYEVVVSRPKATVFPAILRVLTDSNYQTREANLDAGIIQTDARDKSFLTSAQHGFRQRLATGLLYSDMRLNITLTPAGQDSTRMTITGAAFKDEVGGKRWVRVTLKDDDWNQVYWIGDAILEAVR